MRFIVLFLTSVVASILHAPIESFDVATVAEMDHELRTMLVTHTRIMDDENVPTGESYESSDEYEPSIITPTLNITDLSNRVASDARQMIYYETTSAARLHLLIVMNQMYSFWANTRGRKWIANPRRRCDSIRSMLEFDIALIPDRYREDTISGWLLFCG